MSLAIASSSPRLPRYVASLQEAHEQVQLACNRPCPHCFATGHLVDHGRILRYVDDASARSHVGQRLLCSKRGRHRGCGRTWSIVLTVVFHRVVVSTLALFATLHVHASGLCWRQAWLAASPLKKKRASSLRNSYRLLKHFLSRISTLRTLLIAFCPPPDTATKSPLAQTVMHFAVAFPPSKPPFLAFHEHCQLSAM